MGVLWHQLIKLIPWDFSTEKDKTHLATERQWYVLTLRNTRYAIVNTYLAFENIKNREWNEDLVGMLSKEALTMQLDGFKVIIVGDLNAKLGNDFKGALRNSPNIINHNGKLINHMMNTLNLRPANDLEKAQTLFTRKCIDDDGKLWSESILDYFLVGQEVKVKEFAILNDDHSSIESDHYVIKISLEADPFHKKRLPKRKPKLYDIKGASEDAQKHFNHLTQGKLRRIAMGDFKNMDQDMQISFLEESLLSAAKTAFPPKRLKAPKRFTKWGLKSKTAEKMALWKKIRSGDKSPTTLKAYKQINKDLKLEKSKMKQNEKVRIATYLATEDPTKAKFWDIYRSRKDREVGIQALKDQDGTIRTGQREMCDIAYEAFKKRLDGSETRVSLDMGTYDNTTFEDRMMCPVSREELALIISSFKNGRAGGPHFLCADLLKMLSKANREYLRAWVNKCFTDGFMAKQLNEGVIKLIYKRGSKLDPLSYRPITLSCVLGRLVTR